MAVLPLTSDDVKNGTRRIGEERCHKFTGCNHSVQKDDCMYPPRHTERAIIQNSRDDTIVRFRGLCSNCEYKQLIPQAIVDEVKKNIAYSLADDMDPQTDIEVKHKLKWATNRLALELKYKARDENNIETGEWAVCYVMVYPEASDPSAKGGRQWEKVYLNITKPGVGAEVKFVVLNIQPRIAQYERKWNEPVERSIFSTFEQQQQLPNPGPQAPGPQTPANYTTIEDFLRYGDGEMFDSELNIGV